MSLFASYPLSYIFLTNNQSPNIHRSTCCCDAVAAAGDQGLKAHHRILSTHPRTTGKDVLATGEDQSEYQTGAELHFHVSEVRGYYI